jgi:multimeric flavodoxin WrbA
MRNPVFHVEVRKGVKTMRLVVFNGSPRQNPDMSCSKTYIDYVASKYPEHTFVELFIARDIREIQKKTEAYLEVLDAVRECDGILFQMPVYSALVPSQVKAFIELLFEDSRAAEAFDGKYAAMITTSIQLFDNFACNYIQAVCEDLNVSFTGAFSATFYPIVDDEYRKSFSEFIERLFFAIEHQCRPPRLYSKVVDTIPTFKALSMESRETASARRVAVVTDLAGETEGLQGMIRVLSQALDAEVTVVDLAETDYGGCRCCIQCGATFTCCLNDGFQEMHEKKVRSADAIVIAGKIKDRYLTARIKNFFDREFYLNHVPFLKGTPVGLLVSGPLKQNPPIRESLLAILELRGAHVAGVVSDDAKSAEEIQGGLLWLAQTLNRQMEIAAAAPAGFYGKAAGMFFRDFVYIAKYPFMADYRVYREQDLFRSFPQKRYKVRFLTGVLRLMTRLRGFSKTLRSYKLSRAKKFRAHLNERS